MALSLQEQLLQAGLTNKEKAKKARQAKHKKVKANQKNKHIEKSDAQVAAEQAKIEKQQKDKALAEEQKKIRLDKEIKAQVIDLIKNNAQPRERGEVVLNFTDGNKVKRMYVNEAMHKQVTQGRLAVVLLSNETYELVPTPVAEKISERLPDRVVYLASESQEEKASSDEDDWYADYEIPDDLMW